MHGNEPEIHYFNPQKFTIVIWFFSTDARKVCWKRKAIRAFGKVTLTSFPCYGVAAETRTQSNYLIAQ